MRKSAGLLLLLLIMRSSPAPLQGAPQPQVGAVKLPVPLLAQETPMWCWAASTAMVMAYFGRPVPAQCSLADSLFGRRDCCTTRPSVCVNGGWPEFRKFRITYQRTTDQALSWNQLVDQIGARRKPVAFSWHWSGTSGHMMVVTGYEIANGERFLWVNNPLEVGVGRQYPITYAAYVSGADHTHWDDFYDITP